MTNYPPPNGTTYVPHLRAGSWKSRKAVAEYRQARKEADAEGNRLRDRMIARSYWGAALSDAKVRREAAQAQVEKATRRLAGIERQALEDPRRFPEVAQARTELEVVTELCGRLRATEEAERMKLEARIAAAEAQDAIEAAERDRVAARTAAADAERAKLEARIATADAKDAAKRETDR